MATQTRHREANVKRLYYFSLEFLMGRLYVNSFHSAGVVENMRTAIRELGLDIDELREEEYDMGLGNGGLGRLAACFLDSLATLDFPAIGYGIHYQYGLFKQEFRNGYQVELPDDWMKFGTPWEIVRPEHTTEIDLYGHVENIFDDVGNYVSKWTGTKKLIGIPYDIPVPGYGTNTVNFLRLWSSKAAEDFNFEAFNRGGYDEAVRDKNASETVSKVLYPNDKTESGKELRLIQQYFFVACSLKDIIRRFRKNNSDWETFPRRSPSSSTTRTPPSRWWSFSGFFTTNTGSLGNRLVDRDPDAGLHEPHAASRGAREVERGALPQGSPAPSPDHLRGQQALPCRGGEDVAGRPGEGPQALPHRGGGPADGPHGQPRR